MKADFILSEFRKPVIAPKWWEGHRIHYKEYPLEGALSLFKAGWEAGKGKDE